MRRFRLISPGLALAALTLPAGADVREGLVSYWQLDSVSLDPSTGIFVTPDIVTGNHLNLIGMDASALVAGQHGQAMQFDGASTLLALRVPADKDVGLPISRSPQYSVAFWVKGLGTGNNDRRVFSESSSQQNNSLVNIGTHNAGTDNSVDIFIRNSAGTALVNHFHSPTTDKPYDDTWHHVAFVNNNGACTLYLDGVLDSTVNYAGQQFPVDIVSIGAILRGAEGADTFSAFFPGAVDEVGVWERVLTVDEVNDVKANRIQTPVPAFKATISLDPVGRDGLLVGKPYTFTVQAKGTRPFSYQWKKDGEPLPGKTGPALVLDAVQLADTGAYTVEVTNGGGTATSAAAQLNVISTPPADLKRELIAYWPLDEFEGTKTPDYASGYDLTLNNLLPTDLVAGKRGKAVSFVNARQTLLSRVHSPGEQLPMNQHAAFSVGMWVNVDAAGNVTGVPNVDLRLIAEGYTANNNPLWDLGTPNTQGTGQVDYFFRQTDAALGNLGTVDHVKSVAEPLDGSWHHILFVQDEDGTRVLYVDGTLDEGTIPAKTAGNWVLNTTTIGGILRASPSHWLTGLIDDVAVWKRALTQEEAGKLATEGMPAIDRYKEPLAVRSFTADFDTVAKGDKVTLKWDVATLANVTIDNGVGDVTSATTFGVGSAEATVNGNTTFTISVSRDGSTVTKTVKVNALDGVAAGWRFLDNLDSRTAGSIVGQGNWKSPDGLGLVSQRKNNRALTIDDGNDLVALELRSLTLRQGQKGTLFFRVYATDTNLPLALNIGLTDRPIRFIGDFAGNVGPYVRLERLVDDPTIYPQAHNGVGAAYDNGAENLSAAKVYNFWIDVQNNPIEQGDTFTVHVQAEGDAQRKVLFQDYVADRDPNTSPDLGIPQPDLNHFVVAANVTGQGVGNVFIDDVFLSTTGAYNATVPVAAKSFAEPDPTPPSKGGIVWVSFHGAEQTPTAAAITAGFTEAPDAAYTRLLTENNYEVTRYVTTGTPDPAAFAGAALVIVGRSVPSGNYQNAAATAWNSITNPMIVMGGYTIRNSRMGYTTGGTIPDTSGTIRLVADSPTHPIFAGVSLDASGVMANPFAELPGFNGTVQRGISVNTDPLAGNGERIASVSTEGDAANGGLIIGEWHVGSTMGNGTADVLAGHRLVFLSGSREANGLTSEGAGIFDLTADGAKLFLNAVDFMVRTVDRPVQTVIKPVAAGGALGDVAALTNPVNDPATKTITADLPADQSKPAFLSITPAVRVTSVTIENGKLVIRYQ